VKKLAVIVVLLLVAAAGAGWWFYTGVDRPFKGYDAAEQFVEIPQGAGSSTIARRLAEAGVVHDANSFRLALWITGEARRLQAGEYRFDHPISARQVAEKIGRGEVYVRPITFPEGLTIQQMAALYESKGFGDAKTFLDAASDAELVRDIDPLAKDLEGYLFPDTYMLPRRSTAEQLVARMVAGFRKALTADIESAGAAHGLSVRQLVTLASIVEKETGQPQERPRIAQVFLNRLRFPSFAPKLLQTDPTIIYGCTVGTPRSAACLKWDGRIRHIQLEDRENPYNTYTHEGLPPGPIANPGRAALEAVMAPDHTPFLYFVSKNDGTHYFSRTVAEHTAAVVKYQRGGKAFGAP
jgi:UPF0755 protein